MMMWRLHYLFLMVTAFAVMFVENAEAQLIHRYSFSESATGDATGTTIVDSVGGANGTVLGAGSSATGTELVLPGGSSATQAFVNLPNGLVSSLTDVTFEAWYTQTSVQTWTHLFDFGSTAGGEFNAPGGGGEGQDYIFYGPARASNIGQQRGAMRNNDPLFGGAAAGVVGGAESIIDPEFAQALNTEYHVALVYDADGGAAPGDARMTLYINGVPAPDVGGSNPQDTGIQLGNLNDVNNWLGRSQWAGDGNFGGSFNEFRMYSKAVLPAGIAQSYANGPDAPVTIPEPATIMLLVVAGASGWFALLWRRR